MRQMCGWMWIMTLVALVANVLYLLWPVSPVPVVVKPHLATLRSYHQQSMPVLVEASSPAQDEKLFLMVEAGKPGDTDGKPTGKIQRIAAREHGEAFQAPAKMRPGQKINVNTATLEQLQRLPGIGPKMAERILVFRRQHGPLTNLHQLLEVQGIGPKKLEQLLPFCSLQ